MPTDPDWSKSRGVVGEGTGRLPAGSVERSTPVRHVEETFDGPSAVDDLEMSIRQVYEDFLPESEEENRSDVLMGNGNPVALRAVAYFAARCLGRVLWVTDPRKGFDQEKRSEPREVITDLLKKAVAVCAQKPRQLDQKLAAEVRAFYATEMLSDSMENSGLSEMLEAARELADCLGCVYRDNAEDCRRYAVNTALYALKALILICRLPFEKCAEAVSLHEEYLRDLKTLAGVGAATHFDLGEQGPFGPLWKEEAPELLVSGQIAWQTTILPDATGFCLDLLDSSLVFVESDSGRLSLGAALGVLEAGLEGAGGIVPARLVAGDHDRLIATLRDFLDSGRQSLPRYLHVVFDPGPSHVRPHLSKADIKRFIDACASVLKELSVTTDGQQISVVKGLSKVVATCLDESRLFV